MKDRSALVCEAKYLISRLRTVWDEYDFSEKIESYEKRVPKIFIYDNVEVMLDEVHYYEYSTGARYVREYQVKYNGNVYVFEVSVNILENIVKSLKLDVFTPAGDGAGGLVKLVSQNVA